MTNMREFYEKYHLNKYYFAEMAHVGSKTLLKYERGEAIRADSKARIERAIAVVEKHNCVRPRFGGMFGLFADRDFARRNQEYMRQFEYLLNKEES